MGFPLNVKGINPKRVEAEKRLAALRKDKKQLQEKSNPECCESACENSAMNVTYIASILKILTGAVILYKFVFVRDSCVNQQPAVHHNVERVDNIFPTADVSLDCN